jgi:hypothetical protein
MSSRTALRTCGILFCLLAVSNFLKPFEFDAHTGFVLLGKRLHGTPNLIFGPLFGSYLAIYGWGILRMRQFALPMSYFYAAYVIVNLSLFTVRMADEAWARPIFGLLYSIVAIGVSSGSVYLLRRHRADLR